MVNNENQIPKTEMVYELKNEIPTFEEFMKTYEYDTNLNYDDLSSSDIGEVRGYGPCGKSDCSCSCNRDSCSCQWCIKTWGGESGCERYRFFKTSGEG